MRLDRLLSIVIKFHSHKRLTAKQLADEFGVSTRTIFRDLQSISLAHIPIVPIQGNKGGWELMPEYSMDKQTLSAQDIATILSALSGIERGVEHASIKKTVDKMNSLIPNHNSEDIRAKMNHIIIDSQPWEMNEKRQEKVNCLHDAIHQQRTISFSYINLKNQKIKRSAEPMTLMLKGSHWYLFAFCLLKKEGRLFRLSRMQNVTVLNETFERKHCDIQHFKDQDRRPKSLVNLHLTFHEKNSRQIMDVFGSEHITMAKSIGNVHIKIPENDWLYSLLLGFGDTITVKEPKHIASILKTKAERIIKLYS